MGLLSFAPQRDQGLDPITGQPRQLPMAPQGGGKLGLLGATLQDVAAGLNGQVGGSVQRQQAGMLGQQRQAAQQALMQQYAGQLTEPERMAFQLDPEGFLKNRFAMQAEAAKPIKGSKGDVIFDGTGKQIAALPDYGVSGDSAFTVDPRTGAMSFGAQRPMTYGETETGRHNLSTEGLTAQGQAETGRHNQQTERLGLGQLGVSQGNLGVAQGNLSLGRQKFDWEKAGGPAQNATAAAARASLQTVLDNANQFLADIDKTKKDPQLGWRTGASGMIPAIPGSKGAGFDARVGQLQGQAFLRAYDGLRGTGAISEIEGKKATESIARLNRAQSAEDFKAALDDLAGIVRTGAARAQRMAGQSGAPAAPAPAAGGWSIVR